MVDVSAKPEVAFRVGDVKVAIWRSPLEIVDSGKSRHRAVTVDGQHPGIRR